MEEELEQQIGAGVIAAAGPMPTPAGRRRGGVARHLALSLAQSILIAILVALLAFVLVRIAPGNPVSALLGDKASAQARDTLQAELGLNKSIPAQLTSYFGNLLHGNLGVSVIQQGHSVLSIIGSALPITASIVVLTALLSSIFGVALGLLGACGPGRGTSFVVSAITSVLIAIPPVFLGLVLILVFALTWPLLPAGGWPGSWPQNLEYLILPSVALSGYLMPLIARTTRQAAADAMREPWFEAALARNLSMRTLILRHVLPNSLLPTVTLIGLNVGALIGGAVVVESVFGLPGLGQQLVTAVSDRDYALVQGIVLVTALIVVLVNLLTDALSTLIDPRLRRG